MERRVKTLRVITRMNIGGPAIHALLLTRDMPKLGYETLLAAGVCEYEDGDMSYLVQPSDPVIWVNELSRSVSPLNNLAALWKLYCLMRRVKPDVVHTHTAMAGFTGRTAAWLAGVPAIVHTFHGNSLRHYFSPAASRLFLAIERALARVTDRICVIAPQQLDELAGELRIAPASKFRLIPLGLALETFLALPPPAPEGGKLTIGWLGRLAPVKNVPLLIETIGETLGGTSEVKFVVAGDGADRKLLEKAAEESGGRLEYLGWQADVRKMIERCDLLIQTSRNEGTPVALIQGMAAARPFVSTPAGGVVDMVAGTPRARTEGARWFSNGVLVDGGARAFSKVIHEMASATDEVRRMGLEARRIAAERYPKDRLVRDLDALYREVLAEKRQ